jgi:hypothetical protein
MQQERGTGRRCERWAWVHAGRHGGGGVQKYLMASKMRRKEISKLGRDGTTKFLQLGALGHAALSYCARAKCNRDRHCPATLAQSLGSRPCLRINGRQGKAWAGPGCHRTAYIQRTGYGWAQRTPEYTHSAEGDPWDESTIGGSREGVPKVVAEDHAADDDEQPKYAKAPFRQPEFQSVILDITGNLSQAGSLAAHPQQARRSHHDDRRTRMISSKAKRPQKPTAPHSVITKRP